MKDGLFLGVDIHLYNPTISTKVIEKEYKLKDKKIVLYSGKLLEHKGVEYLLKAASEIEADIYIIGSGEGTEALKKYSESLGNKNVHFLGYFNEDQADKLQMFYARADVVVIPSTGSEGIPLSAVEAMASGTPVVATNKGGIPFAVRDGKTGILVPAKNDKAIAQAVNKILKDQKLAAKLSKQARALTEKVFSWQSIANSFIQYYEKTLEFTNKRRSSKKAAFISTEEYMAEQQELNQTRRLHRSN